MVSGVTRVAVQAFEKAEKAKRKAEELDIESDRWTAQVPNEEIDYYVEVTNGIMRREARKLEEFLRRLEKRGKKGRT